MKQNLHFLTLAVHDMARARAFYEALGWQADRRSNPNVTFFQMGQGLILSLYGHAALAEDAGVPLAAEGTRVAIAHNVPERDQVDALLAQAEAAGGRITQPASEVFWGGYRGYFADPEGHLWEVAWNPGLRFDERGGAFIGE